MSQPAWQSTTPWTPISLLGCEMPTTIRAALGVASKADAADLDILVVVVRRPLSAGHEPRRLL